MAASLIILGLAAIALAAIVVNRNMEINELHVKIWRLEREKESLQDELITTRWNLQCERDKQKENPPH